MNEIALLGFFLHVKCWYRMFCVALFFEIHLTSAYFGRNLSFDIFFLISMEPFWIESTVSPQKTCIMLFLEIYHTIFYRALIEGVLSKDLVYNWLYTKYKNIEFLTLFEYHGTWELTVVWRLISCHLHQNPGKEYIYDIPYCAIHLILFENWKRFLSSFFINGRSIQRCCIVRKFEICDIFEMRNLKWFKLRFISRYL